MQKKIQVFKNLIDSSSNRKGGKSGIKENKTHGLDWKWYCARSSDKRFVWGAHTHEGWKSGSRERESKLNIEETQNETKENEKGGEKREWDRSSGEISRIEHRETGVKIH